MYLKKSNYYLLTAFTMLFGCLMMFNACTEDLCEGVDCGENGVNCDEVTGECICDFGWYSDGGRCNKVDSCLISGTECGENASCNRDTGGCECDEGFYGADCSSMNPCADIICPENAFCDSTTVECLCDVGFTAVDGECVSDASVSDYLGIWTQSDDCSDGNNYESEVEITQVASTDGFDHINIQNFGGFATGVEAILDNDDPTRFTIPQQVGDAWTFEGTTTGTFNTELNVLSIEYSVTGTDGTVTCTAIFSKN